MFIYLSFHKRKEREDLELRFSQYQIEYEKELYDKLKQEFESELNEKLDQVSCKNINWLNKKSLNIINVTKRLTKKHIYVRES